MPRLRERDEIRSSTAGGLPTSTGKQAHQDVGERQRGHDASEYRPGLLIASIGADAASGQRGPQVVIVSGVTRPVEGEREVALAVEPYLCTTG